MSSPAERNRALGGLTEAMRREFTRIWMRLDLSKPDTLRDPLAEVLAQIAAKYGSAAAALAADFYDDLREGVVKSGPRFTPIVAETPGKSRYESLSGWGIGPLFGANPDPAVALRNLTGGLVYDVASSYRETIMESSIADPAARGWQRVADAGACTFCQMLAGRGFTYSEAGSDFASHNNCGCTAEPEFVGEPKPVKAYTVSPRRTIDPDTGKPVIDADYLRAKRWIADNL